MFRFIFCGFFAVSTLCVTANAARPKKIAAMAEARIDARLYSQPNTYGKPISIAGKGLKLNILKYSSTRKWALVETPKGVRGWIPIQVTTLDKSELPKPTAKNSSLGPTIGPINDRVNDRAPASALETYGDVDQEYLETRYNERPSVEQMRYGSSQTESIDAELEDLGYGDEYEEEAEHLVNEANEIKQEQQKQGRQSVQAAKSKPAKIALHSNEIYFGLEYANQLSIGNTSGAGFIFAGSHKLSQSFRAGFSLGWNRFVEKAQFSTNLVTRGANVLRIGPTAGFYSGHFGVDALIGWVRTGSTFEVTNRGTGDLVSSEFNGSFAESALSLSLTPSYDFVIDENNGSSIRSYISYRIDFYSGSLGSKPQTIAIGAAYKLSF